MRAVYLALTLLVESGWLGRMHASTKQLLRHCWRSVNHGRRRAGAGYELLHQVCCQDCLCIALLFEGSLSCAKSNCDMHEA